MSISDLFKKKNEKEISSEVSENENDAGQGNKDLVENWEKDGVESAGKMGGAPSALETSLQVVVEKVKKKQAGDEQAQAKWKQEKEEKRVEYETKIKTNENELTLLEGSKNEYEQRKSALNAKKRELETSQKTNKNALVNFIFGLAILAGITIYLFIFYSSTAYSAFFKEFGADNTVITEAMFDAHALANAWADGLAELFFVILIPMLFLGLGYVIHQFNSGTASRRTTLLKITALYALTFVFDCLLAYKISSSIYEVLREQSIEPMPPYSFSMAAGNVDFWTVIFCGFVAYVIWGLVFSFVMTNYEALHKHTGEITRIDQEMTDLNNKISTVDKDIVKLKNDMERFKGEIEKITYSLRNGIVYDWTDIKKALALFLEGWLAFLSIQGKDESAKREVKNVYDKFIVGIDNMLTDKQSK